MQGWYSRSKPKRPKKNLYQFYLSETWKFSNADADCNILAFGYRRFEGTVNITIYSSSVPLYIKITVTLKDVGEHVTTYMKKTKNTLSSQFSV